MATLTIPFTTTNTPTNGYIVKYRQTGTSTYSSFVHTGTSPIIITGLGSGVSYEGNIQADCGNGVLGSVSTFSVVVGAKFNTSYDASSTAAACASTNRNYTFYAAVITLQVGTQVYSNSSLTTAYTNSGGYYSDGTKVYQISSAGVVGAVSNCV